MVVPVTTRNDELLFDLNPIPWRFESHPNFRRSTDQFATSFDKARQSINMTQKQQRPDQVPIITYLNRLHKYEV